MVAGHHNIVCDNIRWYPAITKPSIKEYGLIDHLILEDMSSSSANGKSEFETPVMTPLQWESRGESSGNNSEGVGN